MTQPIQAGGVDPEQIARGPDMEMFGRRIKESRKARGMSLDALAKASGMSKPHIWELERGTSKNPSIRAVWSIAGGLAVTPAYLLGLQTDVSPIDPLALEVAALIERRLRVRAILTGAA